MIPAPPAALMLAVLAAAPATGADPSAPSCRGVAVEYDLARADVRDAALAYQRCLVDDRSPNACIEEFADLDLAQDRFEHAAEARRTCRRQ